MAVGGGKGTAAFGSYGAGAPKFPGLGPLLYLEHGMSELVAGDRDVRRFPGPETVDPFAG